ncbi:MAG: TonB-dependent receptor [Bacteroidia bacterium]|nr:TonB-dependent receptor [Bacteroidia bacterium]
MRLLTIFIFVFLSITAHAQQLTIAGTVQDTTPSSGLKNAVILAVRLKDSTLVNYTRSNAQGLYKMTLPLDTYQIVVTHTNFGDQEYYVFGSTENYEFDFGKVQLPNKSVALKEVKIYAFKDPVYYNGDTLVYIADSFKVKPNAVIEDLLKKLPGIQVDKDGKIKAQGKAIDKVLIDGDEFFGTDPTIATKNLNANTLETVQVYEKKNEDASADVGKETIKVMDLKLKDSAKKGYFGKVSAASDVQKFYEGSVLLNKFKNKQKISLMGISTNTPKGEFGYSDMSKFGLNTNMFEGNDGNEYNMYGGNVGINNGIPRTLKTGLFYNEKYSTKSALTANYSYNESLLKTGEEVNTQYFLTDTNYVSKITSVNTQLSKQHVVNMKYTQKLDSLTELEIKPSVSYNLNQGYGDNNTAFLTTTNKLNRNTLVNNTSNSSGYNVGTSVRIKHNFMKANREFRAKYTIGIANNEGKSILQSSNNNFNNTTVTVSNIINQQKNNTSASTSHSGMLWYVEPLNKKNKLEFKLEDTYTLSTQDRTTLNSINGEYTELNALLTNNFETKRVVSKASVLYKFDTKKQHFHFGSAVRNVMVNSTNLVNNTNIIQNINNVLPVAEYRYNISDNAELWSGYSTSSSQPSVTQLQPVFDNSNPNYITVGNPSLKPNYEHNFNLGANKYSVLSGNYLGFESNYSIVNNDFTSAIVYDSVGRATSQTVNINGNNTASINSWSQFSLYKKVWYIAPSLNGNYYKNNNFINANKNTTAQITITPDVRLQYELEDKITASTSASFTYNLPISSISRTNTAPYYTQNYSASLQLTLPKKFIIESDINYTINSKRTNGYNINYIIWNASIKKRFLKNENLILSFNANDILNQNVNVARTVTNNTITDTKTNIIARYFLLGITWKFNSQKIKDDDNGHGM